MESIFSLVKASLSLCALAFVCVLRVHISIRVKLMAFMRLAMIANRMLLPVEAEVEKV